MKSVIAAGLIYGGLAAGLLAMPATAASMFFDSSLIGWAAVWLTAIGAPSCLAGIVLADLSW
ncbi:MAG: hypothetical protein ABTQ31_17290 [Rhizobiaceae bacterium]